MAIDNNLLMALNTIATQQENTTECTAMLLIHVLHYVAIFSKVVATYIHSDMILHIHTDVLYLVELGAKSRSRGYLFLTNCTIDHTRTLDNTPICIVHQVLKNV